MADLLAAAQPPLPPGSAASLPATTPVLGGGAQPDPQLGAMVQTLYSSLTSIITALLGSALTPVAGGGGGGGALGAPVSTSMGAPLVAQPVILSGAQAALGGSAQTIIGGGGLAAPSAQSILSGGAFGGGIVGGGGTSGSGWTIVGAASIATGNPLTTTIGGGGVAQPAAASAQSILLGGTTTGAVVGGGAVAPAAAPAVAPGVAPAPAVAVAPVFDARRLAGTPQPGGPIATVMASALPTAGAARTEGAWIVLTDPAGAQLQVHVHGAWASQPDRIQEGIQRGYVQVHLHEDGTLHLHDVV